MSDEMPKPANGDPENPVPPTSLYPLRKRTESEQAAYWEGFLAGLRTAVHGIEASIKRFELTVELEGQKQRRGDN